MKTDYHKLSAFDIALVALIFVGVAILSSTIYLALPESAQASINRSIAVLDLSSDLNEGLSDLSMVVGFTGDFMEQFDAAFTEVASLPTELVERPMIAIGDMYEGLADYSANVAAVEYQRNNIVIPAEHKLAMAQQGKVLGISISIDFKENILASKQSAETVSLSMPYGYDEPEFRDIISLIKTKK